MHSLGNNQVLLFTLFFRGRLFTEIYMSELEQS